MLETRKLIGAQLRKLRQERDLSLSTLALMIGMERSYLGKIEAGRINTSIDKLEKITAGLDMDLFEFFDSFER